MIDFSSLTFFLVAALALLITPGPAVLYIVTRSMEQGRRAGFISILGLATGNLFHVAGAALGLGALLLSSRYAFRGVQYLGAAYLIYLGIRKWIEPREATRQVDSNEPARIFRQSVLVNLLNPKPVIFFFAFLPQFVDTSRGTVELQILMLGLLFIALGIVTDSVYALLSTAVGNRIKRNPRFLQSGQYFAGGVYVALGVAAAVSAPVRK